MPKGVYPRTKEYHEFLNKIQESKSCECGCGQLAKSGKKFVRGHNTRINPPNPRKFKPEPKNCECGCGQLAKPGKKFIHHHYIKLNNPNYIPSVIEKRLEKRNKYLKKLELELPFCFCGCGKKVTRKKNKYIWGHNIRVENPMNDPQIRKKYEEAVNDLEFLQNRNNSIKVSSNKLESRLKKSKAMKEYALNPEVKKRFSDQAIKNWQNEKLRQQISEKISKIRIEQWKDPNYVKKIMRAYNVRPNKLELFFESWLNKNFPNEWKYVGDGEVIISGKCPDFVNVNGRKQIIELYGDYWHRGQDPEDRIKIFKPFGYQTLVIWEKELKDLDKVRNKIIEFSKEI